MAAYTGADVLVIEKGTPRVDRPGRGPDSTDAGGLLDYWLDLMGIPLENIPESVVLRRLTGVDFYSPNQHLSLDETAFSASFDQFGVTIDRVAFDDWLREEAEMAGAHYQVGERVISVETTILGDNHNHTLTLSNGEQVEAEYLILADGPQRSVTIDALDQFTPPDRRIADILDPTSTNHIAYQEYRRLPAELSDPNRLTFWWGFLPGHTAYPWRFPNDGNVVRLGLTRPIERQRHPISAETWPLLRETDDTLPQGRELLARLVDVAYDDYSLAEFPLVTTRGKQNGTETYPISSTRPIDSPTTAGIAVTGGAMGGTSAFHEGGYHVAVRTGRIAGYLAGRESLGRYNETWKRGVGAEIQRNVVMAEIVRDYSPTDWDRLFRMLSNLLETDQRRIWALLRMGLPGLRFAYRFHRTKQRFRDNRYVQFTENEYQLS